MKNFLNSISAKIRRALTQLPEVESANSTTAQQNFSLEEGLNPTSDPVLRNKILQTPILFDSEWYLNQYPEIAASGLTPLDHFLLRGAFEGKNPGPVFDTKWYAQQADIFFTQENALLHYLEHHEHNKISPCPLFDSEFYLAEYSDVRNAGINPFSHYMTGGAREGRKPNNLFEPDWYLQKYSDAENPLVHHLQNNSVFSPLFNRAWYEKRYADALTTEMPAIAHYLNYGRKTNFSPNPFFDVLWYQSKYHDQMDKDEDAFAHFVRVGDSSGNSPGPDFDGPWYRSRHVDVAASTVPPFQHFISCGEREGREFSSVGAYRGKVADIAIPRNYDQRYFLKEAPEYEACLVEEKFTEDKPTVIAFYHLTSTADEKTAKPSLFEGHYQPRRSVLTPSYDAKTRFAHDSKLAMQTGVEVFCIEVTENIKEQSLENLLESIDSNFKICLRFADIESLQRQLDTQEPTIKQLINHRSFFQIDSKPVIFFRQVIDLGKQNELNALKKMLFTQLGIEPFIIVSYSNSDDLADSCGAFLHDPSEVEIMKGCDVVNERIGLEDQSLKVVRYTDILLESLRTRRRSRPVIKTVVPHFDSNETEGFITLGSRPKRYEFWLNSAISYSRTDTISGAAVVCLNSWNDWQNGCYLEPDTHLGFAYLNATNRAIAGTSNVHSDPLADSSGRQKIAFLVDSANRTPEALLMLKLAESFKRSFGLDTTVVLLQGGSLQPEFESICQTFLASSEPESLTGLSRQLYLSGFKNAISSSTQSRDAFKAFIEQKFDIRSVGGDAVSEHSRDDERAHRDYAFDLLRLFNPSLVKVSVAVPNYNYAHYLKARLSSIFAQTYPIYELVVLDDCSSDDSISVLTELQNLQEREFQILPNESNSGSVFRQWQKSASTCAGDVIWLAEADDDSSPEFLSALAPRFNAKPNLILAFANSRQTDENGLLLSDNYDEYYNSFKGLDFTKNFEIDSATFLAKGLSVRTAVANVSSALIKRSALLSVLDELGNALTDLKVAGDWRVYVNLCKLGGKVGYIREPLNVHRRHGASVTHSSKSDLLIRELKIIHDLVHAELQDSAVRDEQIEYAESVQRDHAERDRKQATM